MSFRGPRGDDAAMSDGTCRLPDHGPAATRRDGNRWAARSSPSAAVHAFAIALIATMLVHRARRRERSGRSGRRSRPCW
jgi:hypothetical protein